MSILTSIVERKKQQLQYQKRQVPQHIFVDSQYYDRTTLSLLEGVSRKKIGIIAECKQASPSKGVLRKGYNAASIAQSYEQAGAAGISVLTEEHFFRGSLNDLANVRAVVNLPVLRKDFIIDSYQLHEAKSYGADAVLLIADILEKNHLQELMHEAEELGLETLVEIHSVQELEKIPLDQTKLLGINNRNLRTFTVDCETTVAVVRAIPRTITVVSESGIQNANDIQYLYTYGVKNFLIGEAFIRTDDPGKALRTLLMEGESRLCL
ncbi:MAG: indole-3-glycerol phosphate synthase TrpC [Bacteroidetes bacterium]|nr:indole-3-glycerol phosphate synthase TrpC [Bacteroidota bacterium]